jgi:hypothetical protein
VSKREHPRRFAVVTIHEHQRSVFVHEDKSSELFHVQLTAGVVTDDTVDHDNHTGCRHGVAERRQGVFPRLLLCRPTRRQSQKSTDPICDRSRSLFRFTAVDKRHPIAAFLHQIVSQPILPPFHRVQGVQELRGRLKHGLVGERAIMGNGQLFDGRGLKKQVSERSRRRLRELFELVECRGVITGDPAGQFGETPLELGSALSGSVRRPFDKFGIDRDLGHTGSDRTAKLTDRPVT